MRNPALLLAAAILAATAGPALARRPASSTTVCASCVQAHVEHLAAPELAGRRCATADEARAADYLVGEFKALGVKGALGRGGYLQTVGLSAARLAAPATLSIGDAPALVQDRDFVITRRVRPVSGPLVRVIDAKALPAGLEGTVVFLDLQTPDPTAAGLVGKAGAALIVQVAPPPVLERWDTMKGRGLTSTIDGVTSEPASGPTQLFVRPQTADALRAAQTARLDLTFGEPLKRATHNVTAVIHGSAPDADRNAVLLTAHYDHLGVRDGKLFPGANDDASGTAAVLEFARLIKAGPKPKRTVVFALFGCEEEGGFGATYFDAAPPLPLADIAANIEFEMIGLRDPKQPDSLMLTGWDRSNLGAALAEHGAKVAKDLYPEQNFFQRSDNYALAKKGVVAHTISAWPVPPTYHQPTDTAASVDFAFMAASIQSMVEPLRWLLNSDFKPAWNPGGKP
ncbi:hypothetical protein BH09PSE2_BH09PSE2_11500 [soil metagenome]